MPRDDLLAARGRDRREAVIEFEEELAHPVARPVVGEQLGRQVGLDAGELAPGVHHLGPRDERLGGRQRSTPDVVEHRGELLLELKVPLLHRLQIPGGQGLHGAPRVDLRSHDGRGIDAEI